MSAPTETIEAMLKVLREEKAQLKTRLEQVEEREVTLLSWLKEDRPAQTALPITGGSNGSTPLSAFLRGMLADNRPHMLDEISELATQRGLIERGKVAGRVVHFALIGLQQHGYAERRKDGAWEKGNK